MKNFLQEIVDVKKKEIERLKNRMPFTKFTDSKCLLKGVRHFKEAISSEQSVNLIAEIKKKTPSQKKAFFSKLDVSYLARIYVENGAKAISIVTDKRFFGGDISLINKVRHSVHVPVLRKDFIIDEYQVYESRYYGADAILLIAMLLTKSQIKRFLHLANNMGMGVIVEIHNEKDLEKAILSNAEIIGINNRDLDTFDVTVDNTLRLVSKIPKGIIKISESGISKRKDIARLKKAGVHAVLIGTAFLEAEDISLKMKEIMGERV